MTERLRQGPLLYAAPWGGGLRIVVPQPRRSGPQRRGELAVDWAALPEGCLILSEDGGEPRPVSSLQEAMALMGAFDAPRAAMTVLRALNRMRTRALERRQRLSGGSGVVPAPASCASQSARNRRFSAVSGSSSGFSRLGTPGRSTS